jgi:serine/threonine protein kinase
MALSPNTRLGRYEIRSLLGKGGMGEVYLAFDTQLRRQVAIKSLPAEFTQNKARLSRFEREAYAALSLNHPNILTIHEIGQQDGLHYMATEYIEGESLRQHMARSRMELREVLGIAIQVADALSAAHEAGIVHRDIKPENIMLSRDGYVKVLDFGLAKLADETAAVAQQGEVDTQAPTKMVVVKTEPGVVMGTASYMSPEQARGLELDARSDIWSIAIVIYEMVSGRLPFEGATTIDVLAMILHREPASLLLHKSEVPAELERIVEKALAKDKEERYQSAKDLFIDLKRLKHHLDVEAELERTNPTGLRGTQEGAQSSGISKSISPPVSPGVKITGNQNANQTIVADKRITIDSTQGKSGSKRIVAIVTAAVLLASIAVWVVWHQRNLSWARRQVPHIEALSSNGDYFAAYDLAAEIQKYLPTDSTITRLMPTISDMLTVTSEPSGAQVYLKRFSPDAAGNFPPRQLVGTTPIRDLRIARGQ